MTQKASVKLPILITLWDDPYTLGVFVAKARLSLYAAKHLAFLRNPSNQKTVLFKRGLRDSDSFTFADIAYEIHLLRQHDPGRFDAFMQRDRCNCIFQAIKDAVKDAHDWETDDLRRKGVKIRGRIED